MPFLRTHSRRRRSPIPMQISHDERCPNRDHQQHKNSPLKNKHLSYYNRDNDTLSSTMDETHYISNTAETTLTILSTYKPPDSNPTPGRNWMGQLYQGTGSQKMVFSTKGLPSIKELFKLAKKNLLKYYSKLQT